MALKTLFAITMVLLVSSLAGASHSPVSWRFPLVLPSETDTLIEVRSDGLISAIDSGQLFQIENARILAAKKADGGIVTLLLEVVGNRECKIKAPAKLIVQDTVRGYVWRLIPKLVLSEAHGCKGGKKPRLVELKRVPRR